MQNIFDIYQPNQQLAHKICFFKRNLDIQPFFLLLRLDNNVYKNYQIRENLKRALRNLTDQGLLNVEVQWSDNENWIDFMADIKSNFPDINLGSATIINKKSIDDSIKIGLNYSMMRTWKKELYLYSKQKNHLLIPGLKTLKELEEAIKLNSKVIKIFPVKDKKYNLNINNHKDISFIAAGNLSLIDLRRYKTEGYDGIVIGQKGYDGKVFNPIILKWLQQNNDR